MRILGLTGGIASGKSTVSGHLRTLGAVILDADAEAYALAQPEQPLWQAYVEHFGQKILLPDHTLDRAGIGAKIFAEPAEKAWTDAIAHPIIEQRLRKRMTDCRTAGFGAIVLDVPLLFEAGWEKMADEVWVVYVRPEVQLQRLLQRNAYTMKIAQDRIAAQMSLEEKKSRAQRVIDNNGTIEETIAQAEAAWLEFIGWEG